MTSLSKIHKAYKTIESEKKVIAISYRAPINNDSLVIEDEETDNKIVAEEEVHEAVVEAEKLAQDIIAKAEVEAARLIDDEKKKIEAWWESKRVEDNEIVELAKKEGYSAGYIAGSEQAEKELKEQYNGHLLNAQTLLQEAYKIKEEIIQESEEDIIHLSLLIAEKIINREIEQDPNIITELTKEILRSTKEIEHVSIFVNPDYYIYLYNAREDLSKGLNGRVQLLVYPDPSIESVGVVIKTTFETIDAKIDTQLEEVKKILLELSGGDKYEPKY